MRNAHAMVTIYSKLAGKLFTSNNVVRRVTWREAAHLRDVDEKIRIFCRHCHKESQSARCTNLGGHHMIGQFRDKLPESTSITSSVITQSEVYANAGLFGESHTAGLTEPERMIRELKGRTAEDFIDQAQTKVRLWPLIGDTKAVRAGGMTK
jgi:hypothetical protein